MSVANFINKPRTGEGGHLAIHGGEERPLSASYLKDGRIFIEVKVKRSPFNQSWPPPPFYLLPFCLSSG
jgi:hypothetical protein